MMLSVLLFLCAATGVSGFSVYTDNPSVKIKENLGTDLTCKYTGDFGSKPRLEWKFRDMKGSQTYVVFDGKPTQPYANRVTLFGNNLRFATTTRKDNGWYDCEVSSSTSSQFGEATVRLTVLVPPSPPVCRIPTSVTTGRSALLSCHDADGSPPPTYKWYKDGTPLPADPSKFPAFKYMNYKLNAENGNLEFGSVSKNDSGQYYCEAANEAGPAQRCKAVKMEVRDPNTGGIIAGIIVALLLVGLLIFGIWYAKKKGYLPQRSESKPRPSVVYQPPSQFGGGDDDADFKQKSSFVV